MVVFCFRSHSHWWQCFHTCYIIRVNTWQVDFLCYISGHFFGVLEVFEEFFSLFKSQVRPNGDVYDFEVDKKSNHLIWCECPITSLRIMSIVVYAMSSSSTSAYGMFSTSMINFMHLGVAKNCNQHKNIFKKQMVWIDLNEKDGYMGLAFCCGCLRILFSC